MNLKVKNYKNINNLDLEIEEEKVNYIFGISGSGKSSIAATLAHMSKDSYIITRTKQLQMDHI